MDKYQKALDNVKRVYVESEHYDEEDIAILQELVDKETPMKVTDIHVDEFYCPKCCSEISHYKYNGKHPKYCEECGQLLDWSGDDE